MRHITEISGSVAHRPGDSAGEAISVIVPVYNGALHLERCIRSITASRFPNQSCIVVNDGSTDESEMIAGRLGVSILNLPGGPFGPAYARNRGASVALGVIMFFVDYSVVRGPR